MPRLAAIATSVPPHRLSQEDVSSRFRALIPPGKDLERILAVYGTSGVHWRHFAKPPEWYLASHGWESRTRAFLDVGLDLAQKASEECLARADVSPNEVDGVLFVTSTGVTTPSMDARLANRMGFSPGILRMPLWGLGCAGGVAGLARAADMARARPDGRFLMVALELCSLAFHRQRLDKRMVVAGSLFGDGCAAALVEGDDVADSKDYSFVASASHQWPETEYVMGWDVLDDGLDVVFDSSIPELVRDRAGPPLAAMVGDHPVGAWAMHPGGPKVLDALAHALSLPAAAFDGSREILRDYGNMSSPTALFVLERALKQNPKGGVATAALGPGFASEAALLTSPTS